MEAPSRRSAGKPQWSCIVPFYNEAACLRETLNCLMAQSVPAKLILVDNGSTDGSADIALEVTARARIPVLLLREKTRGKVAALARGLLEADTPFVSTCDADTFYPPDYLAAAARVLARPNVVAGGAMLVGTRERGLGAMLDIAHWRLAAMLLPWQCHTGGAGQVFRTEALRRVGGFSRRRWNLVLEDHEIFARILEAGEIGYATDFWCTPSPRDHRREHIGWNLRERLAYHRCSRADMPRFFDDYLRPRLIDRGQVSEKLRADIRLACG